ncbi:serine/threonine protein kinase [Luteimonas viscosa]|uniref:Serine/threonine protein kinase n=1 Tax=Luteimonas viscosa TaxID=1132694 RepID=A0A5D4XPB1_9GAMM|nr:serine/threonine-protein kinase [Luteimonas viscosa]TYT25954.1 serine/threonine protein kinase [Luteimonas viscosa]
MNAGGDPRAELDRLFDEALQREGVERAAFLDAATAGRPQLRAELEELLALCGSQAPALEPGALHDEGLWRSLTDDDETGANATTDAQAGRRIGTWTLRHELGHGGMGTVFLAERSGDGFAQLGALKLIRAGVDTSAFLARFSQERRILAGFNHPGIARLLDGGQDADGRPWLVMEYIEGEPLDRYCDRHRLDVAQRMALFLQVARAVAHAHRHLVVHRDLKPSNILVDADGQAKLLDFGIAKILAPEGVDPPDPPDAQTAVATRIFTPEYAAPEQVLGRSATTAVDVYQLGLLLYELLAGRRAFDRADDAVRRAHEGIEPPAPGSLAFDAAACETRRTTPRALRRALRGDLDTIVLKALRASPERRYATAQALADDIVRWQEGLPIQARPESVRYRATKFVRRHPVGVAGAVASLLLLVAYAATVTMQAETIARERDRARAEAAKAQQVKALVLRLFENADPQSGSAQLSARELLDRGWAGIEAELGDQPEVRIELLDTVAEAYRQLGLYDHAQPLLDAAVEAATTQAAAHPALLPRALRSKGRLRSDQGDYAEAGVLFDQALQGYRALHAGAHADIADTLGDLGLLALREGQWPDAEGRYRESLAMRRQLFGDEHVDVADSLDQLGVVIRHQGDYAGAEPLLAEALALRRRLLPPHHPMLARSLSNLALAHNDLGRYDEAEALYREAIVVMAHSHDDRHHRVAAIKNNLARVLQVRRDYPAAIALLRETLDIRREAFGERHPNVALNLNDLGRLLAESGDADAAAIHYRQALDAYPADHPWRSATVFNLGLLAEEQGDLAAAERHYREALETQRRDYGEDHDRVGTDLNRLGVVLQRQGRLDEAETSLRQALAIYRKRLPEAHPRLAAVLLPLGELLLERGRRAEAEPLLREALGALQGAFGDEDPRTLEAAQALARAERG